MSSAQLWSVVTLTVLQQLHAQSTFVKPPIQNVAAQCFQTKLEFENHCKQLNGVTNGGRCFFFADQPLDWNTAWARCREYGATLAYIHTSSEFQRIIDYGWAIFNASITVLLPLSDKVNGGNVCELTPGTTFWYSDPTTKIVELPIQNGYLYRYHRCDGKDSPHPAPRCMSIFRTRTKGPLMYIGDWVCDSSYFTVLCEFANPAQNFTKSVGKCLGETPTETVPGEDPDRCADECSQRQWCRSFNFIQASNSTSTNQCELFTWSIVDTNVTKVDNLCSHYNYDE